ncbi:MAG: hypothetical protein C0608_00545, partial [Deltaproteobacteria bacterium]
MSKNLSKKLTGSLLALGVAALSTVTIYGCSGGSSSSKSTITGQPVDINGVTAFRQEVPPQNELDRIFFPGHTNIWDINPDFTLCTGGDTQIQRDTMYLLVNGYPFPYDQKYSELTFLTPVFDTEDGVVTASAWDNDPIDGNYSAYLNIYNDARLYQVVDLSAAAAPMTLTWSDRVFNFSSELNSSAVYKVTIRDPKDLSLLEIIYPHEVESETSPTLSNHSVDLSSYAGSSIAISFEQRTSHHTYYSTAIDNVSLLDTQSQQYILNGGFESGDLAAWNTYTSGEPMNYLSGERIIDGIAVTRTFYTYPGSYWARWADTFKNMSASSRTINISYENILVLNNRGIIHKVTGTALDALAIWDSYGSRGDGGFAFGHTDTLDFTSDDALGAGNGDNNINVS